MRYEVNLDAELEYESSFRSESGSDDAQSERASYPTNRSRRRVIAGARRKNKGPKLGGIHRRGNRNPPQ